MKRIFFYMMALLPVMAFAQNQDAFSIKGKVGTLNAPARVYLMYQLGANKYLDSALITNGDFEFSGQVNNPTNAVMVIDHKGVGFEKLDTSADVLNFYIEKGDFAINSPDSVSKAQITGSKINDDNKKLTAQLNRVNDDAKKLFAQQKSASVAQINSEDYKHAMEAKLKALQAEQETTLKTFVASNRDSYLSLLALVSLKNHTTNPLELVTLYDGLTPELKATETGKFLEKSLDELKTTAPGVMAPDFTQNDAYGAPVKLSSFRGKYVLIDFWASWCGPCRQENPNVVKAYNKYKDKNFTVLGVSLDKQDGRANWLAAIKSDGLAWTQVSDLKFWNNQAAALYYVTSIPANFLIDPSGKIVAKDLRGDDLENKLQELLGK